MDTAYTGVAVDKWATAWARNTVDQPQVPAQQELARPGLEQPEAVAISLWALRQHRLERRWEQRVRWWVGQLEPLVAQIGCRLTAAEVAAVGPGRLALASAQV
jgi:hypothetical protein